MNAQGSSEPLVSILIPVFNAERTIGETIESVLAQEFGRFEILAVDDGSTDASTRIIRSFEDPRIRILAQSNSGRAAARNAGCRMATGSLIAFVDADDLWLPEKLGSQINLMNRSPEVGLVYSDVVFFDDETMKERYLLSDRIRLQRGSVYAEISLGDNFVVTSSVIVRKTVLDQVGEFDRWYARLEDWDMWIRLAHLCGFDFVDRPLVRYRMHSDHTSLKKQPELVRREQIHIIEMASGLNTAGTVPQRLFRDRMARIHYNYAFFMKHGQNWDEVFDALEKARNLNPADLKIYLRWIQAKLLQRLNSR